MPDAFGAGAWVFGVAYLTLVVIHSVQFARSSLGTSAAAIRVMVPVNLTVAVLVLVAAAIGPTWGWIAWCAALAVILAVSTFSTGIRFTLRAQHFPERHHLLVIIALGETIIQVGQGSAIHFTELPVVAAARVGRLCGGCRGAGCGAARGPRTSVDWPVVVAEPRRSGSVKRPRIPRR